MDRYNRGADSRQPHGKTASSYRNHVWGPIQPMDQHHGARLPAMLLAVIVLTIIIGLVAF